MKKTLIGIVALGIAVLFAVSGCAKKEAAGTSKGNGTITEIIGDIVYDTKGNETAINGDVSVLDTSVFSFGPTLFTLGKIIDGKTDFKFPSADEISKNITKIDFEFPGIKINPVDAGWLKLDSDKTFSVSADKQDYTLELRDALGVYTIIFIYFTVDTSIQGTGSLFGAYEYDIDIKAFKGWNKVYVKESSASISMKSVEKDLTAIKWFAKKKQSTSWGESPFGGKFTDKSY